jgi:hypothetical protein
MGIQHFHSGTEVGNMHSREEGKEAFSCRGYSQKYVAGLLAQVF